MNKYIIFIFWFVLTGLWAMVIWGGWAEHAYDKMKGEKYPWLLLDLFKIEKTENNCIYFLKIISAIGILVLSVSTICTLAI